MLLAMMTATLQKSYLLDLCEGRTKEYQAGDSAGEKAVDSPAKAKVDNVVPFLVDCELLGPLPLCHIDVFSFKKSSLRLVSE